MGQKMFEIYFCHTSPDCIGFENESKREMKAIVYASTADIVRLRTSPTLFEAYDYVMDILEKKILPRFYRSPEVDTQLPIHRVSCICHKILLILFYFHLLNTLLILLLFCLPLKFYQLVTGAQQSGGSSKNTKYFCSKYTVMDESLFRFHGFSIEKLEGR